MIAEKVQELIASKSAEWRSFDDQIAHWMRELAREVLELTAQECERRDMGDGTPERSSHDRRYKVVHECAAIFRKEAEKL